MVIGYAIDFVRCYRSFVTRSLATLFYLSLACPVYSLRLFLASSLFCKGLNSRYPRPDYFILIIGLFALFCYTPELEQLGRALTGPDAGKKTGPSEII
jgi:hypothetical protein